ncbi:MAG: alcohol dehydrogenase catalytic domain-containing protein [Candidatus Limnocylindrales bacterium]
MIGLVKVAHGDPRLELRDVPLREPSEHEVVLRVAYAGVCGTDLHIRDDHFPSYPPVVLGHEFTGTVVGLGGSVDDRWLGARVVCEPHAHACHVCHLCRRGHPEICADKRSPGWGIDGGFASHVVVPAWLLHRVPDALPDEVAVFAEPMAVTLTALRRGRLAAGDTVLVIGPGPVGLLAALAARAAGAADVVVAARTDGPRSETARRLGFATTHSADAAAYLSQRTEGRGADLVLEGTGTAAGVDAAFAAVRRRGRIAAVGLSGSPSIDVRWDFATTRDVDLSFAMSSHYEAWDPALSILERVASEVATLSTVYPLTDWSAAFAAVEQRAVIKAVIDPTGLVEGES